MTSRITIRGGRQGVTLLELLVVILIMLMLTGLAIPVIAPVLANRQQREASRAINAYIGGARERAIALGRPVGVRLERFGRINPATGVIEGQADICTTLSYIEVPPPYTGDVAGAKLQLIIDRVRQLPNSADQASVTVFAFEPPGAAGGVDFTQIKVQDTFQLDYQGPKYQVIGPDADGNGIIDQVSSPTPQYPTPLSNPPLVLQTFVHVSTIVPFMNSTGNLDYTTRALPFEHNQDPGFNIARVMSHPFLIHRLPVRGSGDALELPEGTVIDLNFAGGDNWSFFWRLNSSFPSDPFYDDPLDGNTPLPKALSSQIFITFAPSGGIDRVYLAYPDSTGPPSGVWGWFTPTSPVYLLVGKRELVRPNLYELDADITDPNAVHFNWQDLSSIWVTISARTGMVTSVENSVAAPWQQPPDTSEVTPVMTRLRQARLLAIEGEGMGGR